MTEKQKGTAKPRPEKKAEDIPRPDARQFGKDFLTGCLALIAIAVIILVLIPLLIFVLKVSAIVAVPLGFILILVIFTAFFGRIINILRRRW